MKIIQKWKIHGSSVEPSIELDKEEMLVLKQHILRDPTLSPEARVLVTDRELLKQDDEAPGNFKLEEELYQSAMLKAREQECEEAELRRKAAGFDHIMKRGVDHMSVSVFGGRIHLHIGDELKLAMDAAVEPSTGNPD